MYENIKGVRVYDEIMNRLVQVAKSAQDVRGLIEYEPTIERFHIPEPDENLKPWAILTMLESGLSVRKDWIDGTEVMIIGLF